MGLDSLPTLDFGAKFGAFFKRLLRLQNRPNRASKYMEIRNKGACRVWYAPGCQKGSICLLNLDTHHGPRMRCVEISFSSACLLKERRARARRSPQTTAAPDDADSERSVARILLWQILTPFNEVPKYATVLLEKAEREAKMARVMRSRRNYFCSIRRIYPFDEVNAKSYREAEF